MLRKVATTHQRKRASSRADLLTRWVAQGSTHPNVESAAAIVRRARRPNVRSRRLTPRDSFPAVRPAGVRTPRVGQLFDITSWKKSTDPDCSHGIRHPSPSLESYSAVRPRTRLVQARCAAATNHWVIRRLGVEQSAHIGHASIRKGFCTNLFCKNNCSLPSLYAADSVGGSGGPY